MATIKTYSTTKIDEKLQSKQDKLVSGTNIKTINGKSILGSGNLIITGSTGGQDVKNGIVDAGDLSAFSNGDLYTEIMNAFGISRTIVLFEHHGVLFEDELLKGGYYYAFISGNGELFINSQGVDYLIGYNGVNRKVSPAINGLLNSRIEPIRLSVQNLKEPIRLNRDGVRYNSDRLKILEAQINADKNTIEYTSDSKLEITCGGANIVDCNAVFKSVKGVTRRKSLNLLQLETINYEDARFTLQVDPSTGIVTVKTKTLTEVASVYFGVDFKRSGIVTVVNSGSAQFNIEARKKDNNGSDWFSIQPYDVLKVDMSKYSFISPYFQFNSNSDSNKTFVFKPMILEGDVIKEDRPPFEPFDNTLVNSKANFLSTGRNLFASESFDETNMRYDASTCEIRMKLTDYGHHMFASPFTLPKGTYTLMRTTNAQINTMLGAKDGEVQQLSYHEQRKVINLKEDTIFTDISVNGAVKANFKFAIVAGDVPYDTKYFEPYTDSKCIISEELGKFDYIDFHKQEIVRQTSSMITIDGSENWWIEQGSPNKRIITGDKVSMGSKRDPNSVLIASNSMLEDTTANHTWSDNTGRNMISYDNGRLHIVIQGITTPEKLKQWLKQNPVTLVIKTADETISTFKGNTGFVAYKGGLTRQQTSKVPYEYIAKFVNGGV